MVGALILAGTLYAWATLTCGYHMHKHMKTAADRRDYHLREMKRYGPEHNYSIRMRASATKWHRDVKGWAVAFILSPLWPVHALVWLGMKAYYDFVHMLKWKG